MIIRLLLIIGVLVAFWFIFSQIILPAWHDRKLFPIFGKIGEARRSLKEARDRRVEAGIRKETAETATDAAKVEVNTQRRIADEYENMYAEENSRAVHQYEKQQHKAKSKV